MSHSYYLHALHRYQSMRVMQQAVRRMVKTAQKFARRTAAAIKMQVMPRCLCIMRLCPPVLLYNSKAPHQLWPGNICCTQYRWPALPTKHEMMSHTSPSYTHNVAQRDKPELQLLIHIAGAGARVSGTRRRRTLRSLSSRPEAVHFVQARL